MVKNSGDTQARFFGAWSFFAIGNQQSPKELDRKGCEGRKGS
jgi:hypothetical protein